MPSLRVFLAMLSILKRLPILLALYVLLAVVVTFVQVAALRFHDPHSTAWMRMRARQAREQGKPLVIRQTWVPLSELPRTLPRAVIAAEDEKFYTHHGFDWDALKQAYELNERKERVKRGGSTITQQLAKNLFLSPSRSYIRKAREAAITSIMELLLPKDRILEIYLNCIEFGPGVFGVEEGAKYHFGIPARRLSLEQSCVLASIIPAPLRYRVTGPYVQRRAATLARIIAGSASARDSL